RRQGSLARSRPETWVLEDSVEIQDPSVPETGRVVIIVVARTGLADVLDSSHGSVTHGELDNSRVAGPQHGPVGAVRRRTGNQSPRDREHAGGHPGRADILPIGRRGTLAFVLTEHERVARPVNDRADFGLAIAIGQRAAPGVARQPRTPSDPK